MAIKKLQNNFTIPEQSKRLLELGVPRWSADNYRDEKGYRHSLDGILDIELFFQNFNEYLPCWSAGRLMEIAHICSGSTFSYKKETEEIMKFKEEHKCNTLIEAVIMCIEDAYSLSKMDFSKLED